MVKRTVTPGRSRWWLPEPGRGASHPLFDAALFGFRSRAQDLALTCHAHPTLTEAVKEAALSVDKRAIHM